MYVVTYNMSITSFPRMLLNYSGAHWQDKPGGRVHLSPLERKITGVTCWRALSEICLDGPV